MTTNFNGHRIFRGALLGESAVNIGSMIPMILAPEAALSYLVKGPSQITPATKTMMQWFGGLIVLATAPLLLSYPNPSSDDDKAERERVVARRRLTYQSMAAAEAALGTITAVQYLTGSAPGLTDSALLVATAAMGGFMAFRSFVL